MRRVPGPIGSYLKIVSNTNPMKKILLMLLLMPMLAFAQSNQGYNNDNQLMRVDYMYWTGSSYLVKILNKQGCDIEVRVSWPGQTGHDTLITVPAGQEIFINLPADSPYYLGTIKAKTPTVCVQGQGDSGWLEIGIFRIWPLSVKLGDVTKQRIAPGTYKIGVRVLEIKGENILSLRIKVGGSERVIPVRLVEGIHPPGVYYFTIKL